MADNDKVDPDRPHIDKPFNRDEGYTGQGYRADDEHALGRDMPAGQVAPPGAQPRGTGAADLDLPPDNGRRAAVDPATGEVRGSGVGAGGGEPGEDLDQDSANGDGPVITGRSD